MVARSCGVISHGDMPECLRQCMATLIARGASFTVPYREPLRGGAAFLVTVVPCKAAISPIIIIPLSTVRRRVLASAVLNDPLPRFLFHHLSLRSASGCALVIPDHPPPSSLNREPMTAWPPAPSSFTILINRSFLKEPLCPKSLRTWGWLATLTDPKPTLSLPAPSPSHAPFLPVSMLLR